MGQKFAFLPSFFSGLQNKHFTIPRLLALDFHMKIENILSRYQCMYTRSGLQGQDPEPNDAPTHTWGQASIHRAP